EEAYRRWLGAAALVRGGADEGVVVAVGDAGLPAIQALVRWSPLWLAERELAERRAAGFPPACRLAAIEGPRNAVTDLVRIAELPPSADVLGPVTLSGEPGEAADGVDGPTRSEEHTSELQSREKLVCR